MKEYVPVKRRTAVIGANLKPGRTPGGMSTPIGKGRRVSKKRPVSALIVKEAATAALKRLGVDVDHQPDAFRDTAALK